VAAPILSRRNAARFRVLVPAAASRECSRQHRAVLDRRVPIESMRPSFHTCDDATMESGIHSFEIETIPRLRFATHARNLACGFECVEAGYAARRSGPFRPGVVRAAAFLLGRASVIRGRIPDATGPATPASVPAS
jgi:hypothetical protein